MNYDKNSFLSGLAVGRQLKGWGLAVEKERAPDPAAETVLAAVAVIPASAALGGSFPDAPVALGWLSVGEVLSIPVYVPVMGTIPETPSISNVSLEVVL